MNSVWSTGDATCRGWNVAATGNRIGRWSRGLPISAPAVPPGVFVMTGSSNDTAPAAGLVEHFFRHESGRLVSTLARMFGWRNLDLVEDMVQAALMEALRSWRVHGAPQNPSGWIRRVARNKVIDALRHRAVAERLAPEWAETQKAWTKETQPFQDLFLDSEIEDSQLRMIFACCHPDLPASSSVALTLKTLCGFGNQEIARALLLSEENVRKRIYRAKQELADRGIALEVPAADELPDRLGTVHEVLYLLFNEGYSVSSGKVPLRTDMCEEAARLCHLLTGHPRCAVPATYALLALMLFHAARLNARLDHEGGLLLLEDQDRSLWDRPLIRIAAEYLGRSDGGGPVSTFHLEAGIAMLHCRAESFADTDWTMMLKLYDRLLEIQRSPIYLLNRAVVLAQLHGPDAGVRAIEEIRNHPQLCEYHLLDATLGELQRRAGRFDEARASLARARESTQSAAERALIDRRLATCG